MRFLSPIAPIRQKYTEMRILMRFFPMVSEKIGQLVRARRKLLRLRQRDLSELAGVTLRGLTEIENGRGNPTLLQLAKIAAVLGLEVTLSPKESDAQG
jgi:DNA-binding XRE family transcriptional regulator